MPEITTLATVGLDQIEVMRRPRVAVVSTGDELVEINSTPQAHQIRRSNHLAISSILDPSIADVQAFHLQDDPEVIKAWLEAQLPAFDLLVFSGGVSMGKKDYLPQLLRQAGIEEHFHKVRQRPGKPLWFGTGNGTAVFGLPGNPVSTAVCATQYVREVYLSELLPGDSTMVTLSEEFTFDPQLTLFQPVVLTIEGSNLVAIPKKNQGSGDLAGLLGTDGIIKLPETRTTFNAGERFPYFPWKRN